MCKLSCSLNMLYGMNKYYVYRVCVFSLSQSNIGSLKKDFVPLITTMKYEVSASVLSHLMNQTSATYISHIFLGGIYLSSAKCKLLVKIIGHLPAQSWWKDIYCRFNLMQITSMNYLWVTSSCTIFLFN